MERIVILLMLEKRKRRVAMAVTGAFLMTSVLPVSSLFGNSPADTFFVEKAEANYAPLTEKYFEHSWETDSSGKNWIIVTGRKSLPNDETENVLTLRSIFELDIESFEQLPEYHAKIEADKQNYAGVKLKPNFDLNENFLNGKSRDADYYDMAKNEIGLGSKWEIVSEKPNAEGKRLSFEDVNLSYNGLLNMGEQFDFNYPGKNTVALDQYALFMPNTSSDFKLEIGYSRGLAGRTINMPPMMQKDSDGTVYTVVAPDGLNHKIVSGESVYSFGSKEIPFAVFTWDNAHYKDTPHQKTTYSARLVVLNPDFFDNLKALKEEAKTLKEQNKTLERTITDLRARIQELETQVANGQGNAGELQTQINTLRQKLQEAEQKLVEKSTENVRLQEELNRTKQSLERTEQALSEKDAQIRGLEQAKNRLEQELENLKTELAHAKELLKEKDRLIEQLKNNSLTIVKEEAKHTIDVLPHLNTDESTEFKASVERSNQIAEIRKVVDEAILKDVKNSANREIKEQLYHLTDTEKQGFVSEVNTQLTGAKVIKVLERARALNLERMKKDAPKPNTSSPSVSSGGSSSSSSTYFGRDHEKVKAVKNDTDRLKSVKLKGSKAPATRAEVATEITRAFKLKEIRSDKLYNDRSQAEWANEVITKVTKGDIMIGDNHDNFNPNSYLTRAEFAVIASRLTEISGGASVLKLNFFTDVSDSHWGYSHIQMAVNNGFIVGYPDGTFKPNKPISGEEVMFILERIMKK